METIKKSAGAPQGDASPIIIKKKKKVVPANPVDEKNLENAKETIKKEKDLMYGYPVPDMTGDEKKKYRAAARRTRASYEKKIAVLQTAEPLDEAAVTALQAEARKWAKATYSKSYLPNVSF
jgi:hypothetical protein